MSMKINKFIKMKMKMRNIIPLNNFLLEEALPLSLAKEYVKMGLERNPVTTAKMDVIFNNKQRIYLPVGKKVKSTVEPQIKEFLETLGYGIKDYIQNLAFKLDNPKREIKIGKLLSQNKREDLRDLFLRDPIRELATQQAEYSVVISRHPYDVAGMSCGTGRESWHSSCLNIRRNDGSRGQNAHYVPAEIKNGTLTAYYIKTTDKNINAPLGRVNVKPYKKESELDQKDKQKCYFPDTRVYGSFPPDAILALKEWIISWQGDLTGDFYKWKGCYDYDGTAYHIRVNSNMDIYQVRYQEDSDDEEEEDPWDNAPHYSARDAYHHSEDVENFWDFFDGHCSDVSVDDYNMEQEYLGDGDWTIDNGYIQFSVTDLILDEGTETISWFMDGYISCHIQDVINLTFENHQFDNFMDFYSNDAFLRVAGTLSFINCDFYDADGAFIPTGYSSFGYRNFRVRDVNHLKIEGGDWINTLSILNIYTDLLNGRGIGDLSSLTITLKDVNYAGIDDEDLKILEDLILEYKGAGATVEEINPINIEEIE